MKDPGLSHSPEPSRPFDATDQQLSTELSKWTGATPALRPVGELLDRHWEAGFAYARLCTDGPHPAGMLTTASFTRLFGQTLRQSGPTAAWRPQLLVTVRRIAAEWSTDHRRDMLHPDLRTAGSDDRVAARLLPPPDRCLLSQAFQRLPQTPRALLWHAEVEAEPLAAPARLLGLDKEDARVGVRRARERLREECLQVHRDVAPEQDCLRYFRLLDVTCRRGGVDADPDLREHLAGCTHCRYTGDQLSRFNVDLGTALAEGVLGWGARQYRYDRVAGAVSAAEDGSPAQDGAPAPPPSGAFVGGEAFTAPPPRAPAGGETFDAAGEPGADPAGGDGFGTTSSGGPALDEPDVFAPFDRARRAARRTAGTRIPNTASGARRPAARPVPDPRAAPQPVPVPGRRAAARRSAHRAARRAVRHRNLAIAVATVSGLVVLPLVLWSVLGSGDDAAPGTGPQSSGAPGPSSGIASPGSSWAGAGGAGKTTLRGRLHNVASGLCVGIVGGKAVEGAETELTTCSSARGQQWVYETDGLLRSGAAPGLCLDSHLGWSVELAPCTDASAPGARNIRYDFTLQGTLVPRFDQDLALTPAATDGAGALVLKTRTRSETQRWVIDPAAPEIQMDVADWDGYGSPSARPSAGR